jgi:hypothetical protein
VTVLVTAANGLAEVPPEEARNRMTALGWPADVVEGILAAQAAMTTGPATVTSAVEEVTGTPARPFESWVREHRHLFF